MCGRGRPGPLTWTAGAKLTTEQHTLHTHVTAHDSVDSHILVIPYSTGMHTFDRLSHGGEHPFIVYTT